MAPNALLNLPEEGAAGRTTPVLETHQSPRHAREDGNEGNPTTSSKVLSRSSSLYEAQSGMITELWASRAWRIYPMMLLYIIGMTMLAPLTPTLLTNFFASRAAGEPLRCEALRPEPPACQNAHSTVVTWSTWSSFVSNSLVSVLLMPFVGELTDAYGRKPFLALAIVLASLPVLVLLLHIETGFSLLWYYPSQVLSGMVSSISVSLAFLADCLSPASRAASFGILMAAFSMGLIFGPLLGGIIIGNVAHGPRVAILVAIMSCGVSVLYVLLLLPESLPARTARKARRRLSQGSNALSSTWRAVGILMRSSLFRRLTVCLMLSGAVLEGLFELLVQYLQLVAHFGPVDQARLFVVFGVAGLLVQAVILPWMLHWLKEYKVLSIGLLSSLLQQLVLAFCGSKWQGYLAVALGSLGSISFPAISAIKSNNASEHEQGAVQGALYGARSLAMGLGPLAFAWVFRNFSRSDSGWPYWPGAPFLLGSVISTVALGLAVSLHGHAAGPQSVTPLHASEDTEGRCSAGGGQHGGRATESEGESDDEADDVRERRRLLGREP